MTKQEKFQITRNYASQNSIGKPKNPEYRMLICTLRDLEIGDACEIPGHLTKTLTVCAHRLNIRYRSQKTAAGTMIVCRIA